jgi:hypothetical protein
VILFYSPESILITIIMKLASLFTTLLLLAVDVRPVSAARLHAGTPEEQERLKLKERPSIHPFIDLIPPQVDGAAPVDLAPLDAADLARKLDARNKKLKDYDPLEAAHSARIEARNKKLKEQHDNRLKETSEL